MHESEVLIVDIPDQYYDILVESIVRYSIISLPFTIDRMNQIGKYGIVKGNKKRISNIFKGKLAESLFKFFCEQNNLQVDFKTSATPFYQVDRRDFIYNGTEYDIKNNFIYHSGELYKAYTHLPALIPNRHQADQWSSRLKPHFKGFQVGYIFSFLKGADFINGDRGDPFYQLKLNKEQGDFLHQLYLQYRGKSQKDIPFSEEWFWNTMASKGDLNFFSLRFRPKLIITGVTQANNWHLFRDVGPYSQNNYQNDPIENWYAKVGRNNSVKFLRGEIWATITNKTAPVSILPSIKNVFNNLNGDIKFGRFKASMKLE